MQAAPDRRCDWRLQPAWRRLAIRPALWPVLLLATLLFGCGNSPYSGDETGQVALYTVFGDDPPTIDPSLAYDFNSEAIASLIYPSYFQYHYLKRDPLVLLPALGAGPPIVEPTPVVVVAAGRRVVRPGQKWTFRIKRGLRFQDDPCFPDGKGREILGADFLSSFRRRTIWCASQRTYLAGSNPVGGPVQEQYPQ